MIRNAHVRWGGVVWDRRPGKDYIEKFDSLNAFARSIDGTSRDLDERPDKVAFQYEATHKPTGMTRSQRVLHAPHAPDQLHVDLENGTASVSHFIAHPNLRNEVQELFTEFSADSKNTLSVTEGARIEQTESSEEADWTDSFKVDRKTGLIVAEDPFADNWFQFTD